MSKFIKGVCVCTIHPTIPLKPQPQNTNPKTIIPKPKHPNHMRERQILVPKCFFLAVVYFYIGVMYSCVRGHNSLQLLLAKVRIQYTKIAFRNLAYRLWNWGHYIANSPSCENGTSFQFFKISHPPPLSTILCQCVFSLMVMGLFAKFTPN